MQEIQKKSARYKKLSILGMAVILLLVICFWFAWKNLPDIATTKIYQALENRGIKVNSLNIKHVDLHSAIFSNIELGNEVPLKIGSLDAEYTLPELNKGKIRKLVAEGLEVNIYKKDGKWVIGALEDIKPSQAKSSFNISDKERFPEAVTILNSKLTIKDPAFNVELPFNLDFKLNPEPILKFTGNSLTIDAAPYNITTAKIDLSAIFEVDKWQGNIAAPSVIVTGLSEEMPPLILNADFSLTSQDMLANVTINDKEEIYKAAVGLSLPITNIAQGILKIKDLQLPWGGGQISVNNINIPVLMDKLIPININLHNVELSQLLGKVSNERIKGTGKVNGTLPLIYHPDGHITLQEGGAQALGSGIISVPPSFLPGNNVQLETARTALENFHYTTLKIIVSSGDGDESTITLLLEGNNPEAFEGRPIKLSVNLTGDILPLIQQSLLPMNNLKRLLKIKETL